MSETTKAVDGGAVDDLLLGDGFSIVDSTKSDSTTNDDKKSPEEVKNETVEVEEAIQPKEEIKEEVKTPKDDPKPKDEVKPKEEPVARRKEEPTPSPIVKVEEPVVKEDPKVNGHDIKSDALLITTEEDLDLTVDKETTKKDETESIKDEPKKGEEEEDSSKEKPKAKQGDLWVSNITRHIKATDLKKHFSKQGKVLTAKIVTNGKSFFGYILMENPDVANKCVKSLHGTSLDGRKIAVSRQRPDQRKATQERKVPTTKTKPEKKPEKTETKKSDSKEKKETTIEKKKERSRDRSYDRRKDEAIAIARRNAERFRREADYLKRELNKLKRVLTEEQRRHHLQQQKNRTLGRELQDAENKLRDERRKSEKDRELYEKNTRTDRIKMEADRNLIKKELDEVKKLREYLKRKIEEEEARPVERRPRASSPYAYSSKRMRSSSNDNKKRDYVEERTRTPPSPPKLSSRSKRSPVASFASEKERRGHHYIPERTEVGRHGSSLVIPAKPSAPAAPRNIWPSAFHQEVWRVTPGSGGGAPFSSGGQSSYPRQSDYGSGGSSNKTGSYQSRDFPKREHYSSSSASRKY